MTSNLDQLKAELREHRRVLQNLLAEMQQARAEQAASSAPARPDSAKNFLALLSGSLDRIRRNRAAWAALDPGEKAEHPEMGDLLRESQDTILKILVLDRESEGPRGPGGETSPRAGEREGTGGGANLLAKIYGRPPPGEPS